MVIGCIAKGCENKQRTYTNVMFHRIPSNVERRNQWLAALAICTSTPVNKINQYRVCEEHFTPEDYVEKMLYGPRKMVLRLKDTAVPSIFKAQAEQSAPSTSTHVPISQDMPSIKCREYQTQHRPPVSAEVHAYPLKTSGGTRCTFAPSQSTPFSFTKQTGHARSRGVQAPVVHTGVSTETTQVETCRHLSSKPMKASTSGLGATPAKRPRMELLDEDEGNLSEISQSHDTTHEPGDSVAEPSETSGMDISCDYTDAKYIVFESSLRELFETCPLCKHDCDVQRRRLGTFVSFSQVCKHCQYTKKWQSQPVRGSTPVGNLQMSAAVYFTGGSFIQMDKICRAMNLQIHHYNTFRKHARLFLEPSIHHKWKMDQQAMFQQLQPQGKIALSGDMRAVSPGHTAKYCSYTLTHLESNTILDIQLVQSKEVGGRAHMEKEGLRRGLDLLESNQLHVDYIVTDRHPRVQKYLRERDVKQYYGVWHLEKGLSKKLEKLSRNKYCRVLRKWLLSIKNHIYWSIMSSKEGPEKVAKWKSLVGHIQNVHIHEDPLFPQCAHPDRVSRDPSKWLKPGSRVLYKVEKLLMNKRVLRDVEKLSHQHQTSALESFHSVIQRFAPNNVVFPFIGMLCRVYLAAMHFNENADREQAMTFEGTAMYPTAKPTFGYVGDLMRLLFMKVFDDPATFVEELRKVPISV